MRIFVLHLIGSHNDVCSDHFGTLRKSGQEIIHVNIE